MSAMQERRRLVGFDSNKSPPFGIMWQSLTCIILLCFMVLIYVLFSERFYLIPFISSIVNIVQFYNSILYFFNYMRYVLFIV